MRIEILCTGDEILTGKTINTNHSHIARRLGEVGLTMHHGTVVGDDRASLLEAFRLAAGRVDAVIVNGGLGPTVDDLSQEIAAEAAGVDLVLDEAWLARMEAFYANRGRTMPPNNRKQAMLPTTAEFIDNPVGTACGFAVNIDGTRFFFTPGVPREMRRMIDEQVIPRLLAMSGSTITTRLKRFHSFGIGESRADQMLDGIEALDPRGRVKLGFQAHYPQLETKLLARASREAELDAVLEPAIAAVRERLGNFIIAEDDQTLEGSVAEALQSVGGSLAIAETVTGGAMAARFLPGGSTRDLLLRGVVSRDVSQLIEAAGLHPEPGSDGCNTATATRIASAFRARSGASHSLVSLVELDDGEDGIGLGGTICIAIADGQGTVQRKARILGGRDWVRLGTTDLGIDCLRRHLGGLPIDEKIDFEKR